eukprot:3151292-Pleurochrysis_carterae.AAC.6
MAMSDSKYAVAKKFRRCECYGKAIATGKLIMEQAAEKFALITDPARCPAAAAAAFKRYQGYQAQTGGGNPKPVKLERMRAMTKVVTCYNVDLRPATSPGFVQGDGHVVLYMDSKYDQQMFNDMRWFPFGVTTEPNVLVKTAEKGRAALVIEFTNALPVPDLNVNLASVEQAMVQNKVEVRFGEHLDMVFHMQGKSIPLEVDFWSARATTQFVGVRVHLQRTPRRLSGHHYARQGSWRTIRHAFRGGHSMAVGCAPA